MGIDPLYLWIGIGFALVIAEVTMGNFILFFLGLASVCVGGAVWLGMPADGALPYLLFVGLAVFFLLSVRSRMPAFTVGDIAASTEDEDFVGRNVTVESGFDEASPGRGRVNYRGASWDAQSSKQHFAAGEFITIIDRSGNLLIVDNEGI
jgi:membrane protein implicated in regulation of membrane protease activity